MAIRDLARHRTAFVLALLVILGLFLATAGHLLAAPHQSLPEGCTSSSQDAQAINASAAAALAQAPQPGGAQRTDWRVQSVCQQDDWAYVFVKGFAAGTGTPVPGPSQVALSHRTAAGWQAVLPSDAAAYDQALAALPSGLLPAGARTLLSQPATGPSAPLSSAAAYFSGFALPFPAGVGAYVHWHWYAALDFTIASPGTVRAAKGGTAVFVKGSSTVECGDPPPNWTCWMYANAIVIQSGPKEYAWYLHFAPNTIPAWIHEGVYIPAGADIAQQGMTGWASLPHLHFQVSSWYACCTGSGDGRFPTWPAGTIWPVDFNEYTWAQMPYLAVSQNGSSPAPTNPPPAPPTPTAQPPQAQPVSNRVPTAAPTAAPASPVPAAAASPCSNPYTIQRGDYLIRIAANCNVDETALIAANPGLNPNLIFAGQLLNLPLSLGGQPAASVAAPTATQPAPSEAAPTAQPACTGTHVVAPGETLYHIATTCGVNWQQMASANGIGSPYWIYAGESLRYP